MCFMESLQRPAIDSGTKGALVKQSGRTGQQLGYQVCNGQPGRFDGTKIGYYSAIDSSEGLSSRLGY